MKAYFKNKKGQAIVLVIIILAVIGLLVLGVSMAIGNRLLTDFNDEVQSDNNVFDNYSQNVSQNLNDRMPKALDSFFLIFAIGLVIAIFIAGLTLDNSPLFLIIAIILLFVLAAIGMVITNSWEEMQQDNDLSISSSYPNTNYILTHLGLYFPILIFSFGLGIVFKNRLGV